MNGDVLLMSMWCGGEVAWFDRVVVRCNRGVHRNDNLSLIDVENNGSRFRSYV